MKVILPIVLIISLLVPLGFAYYSEAMPEFVAVRIQEQKPLLMGVIPYLQPEALERQIKPIFDYLSFKLKRKVKLVTVSDYEGLGRLLELKRIQLAWFSDTSYRKLKKNNPWEIICRPVQYGTVVYRGQIIVHKDTNVDNIHQLRNRSFAYVDRYSGSGFYYPNLLFHQENIEPLSYFSEVIFSQSHKRSILGVLDGIFDAAAVFSVDLLEADGESYPETDYLKVIARTAPIPNDPLVVRKDLDTKLKDAIARAMLSMHEDEQGKEHLKTLLKLRGTEKFVSEAEVKNIIAQEEHKY